MRLCLATLVVVSLLVLPATAQQRGRRGQGRSGGFRPVDPIAKAIDADNDGSLSAEEIANATARLRALDANGNGSIDSSELRNAMWSAMGRRGPGAGSRGGGPGSGGSASLERTGLKVGDSLPDIAIHDAKGGKFRMADVKGKYTVIVFGCLT